MLSIALISTILVLYVSVFAFRVKGKWKRHLTTPGKHNGLDKRINLVLSLASMVLVLRLLSYPLFYTALQSFVKDIEGAMCIYGVTEVLPCLCRFLEIIKPVAFFFIGGWLIFHSLTGSGKTRSLILHKLTFLLAVTLGILVDSVGDLVFFLSMNSHTPVTCCTSNIDSPDRISAILSRYLLGHGYEQSLSLVYYLSNLSLLGAAGYLIQKKRLEKNVTHRKRSLGLVFLMGLVNLFLTGLALLEVVGPGLMNLPHHHCPYCLLQYVPDACLIIGLLILGTFGFGWAFGLEIIVRDKEMAGNLSGNLNKLYRFSFSCLSLSLLMVSVHLILGGR